MSAADLNLPELNFSVDATVARSIDHAEVSLERLTAFQQELGNVSDVENYDALSQIVLEIHAKVLVMIG